MNVRKLHARRTGRRRETITKEFDQAGSEFGSTVFEKAREGMENVIKENFNYRDEVVRDWRSMRSMPIIIQSRLANMGLSVEFSFRERRDSSGTIWLK